MAPGIVGGEGAIPDEVVRDYDLKETLGTGHFSKVKLGINKKTGEKCAVKIIEKPSGSKIAMLKAEVDILTKCDHPNVVKMYAVYETETHLFLCLELLTGGELFDRIISKGHYSEEDARKLTVTLLEATAYLHSLGIAHRDLKPENILLKDEKDDSPIKITDFGLSKIFADDLQGEVVMKTACGTPGYVAPEVLTHEIYSEQVDMWSIGVIVYILLCGFPPFYGDNDAQMFKKIKAGSYKFLAPYWDPISAEAKDFVSKLLVVDPKKRMTSVEALKHPWVGKADAGSTNLFAKKEPKDGTTSEVDDGTSDLHQAFVDFNLDRKVSLPEKLMEKFALPKDSAKLGKFKCSLGNQPGHFYVTTYDICFLGSLGKKLKVELKEVKEVKKAKRFKMTPGKGHSIHIVDTSGSNEFNGFGQRDECYKLLMEQCQKLGTNTKFADER
ncbi:hypothetical protein AB1Y20_011543 [Prymnesium parvum]|uniref:Protein kinase domain-containing protein n=1 Tax=Prymnesium parvum TaxID=97485 RepID=A0AB34IJG1_PRYPA